MSENPKQKKLDAAFLKAVKNQNDKKVTSLFQKGANILAQDEEGNGAFHYLAVGCFKKKYDDWEGYYLSNKTEVNNLICSFLNKGLKINASNKKGQTCLHQFFSNKALLKNLDNGAGRDFINLFLRHVTDVTTQDIEGKTVLHLAASHGPSYFLNKLLEISPSVVDIKDKEGNYLRDSADKAGYSILAHRLTNLRLDYLMNLSGQSKETQKEEVEAKVKNIKEEPSEKVLEEQPKPVSEKAESSNWHLLSPEKISLVETEEAIGYKITQIFNFHARTYTKLAQNLETKSDVIVEKEFDQFIDKTVLFEAHAKLMSLGGEVDEAVIGERLFKKRLSRSSKFLNKVK